MERFRIRMHLSILSLAAATSEDSTADIIQGNCQAQVESPKVKTKRTWADTKITRATHF